MWTQNEQTFRISKSRREGFIRAHLGQLPRKHALYREESALENEKFYRVIYLFTFFKSSEGYRLTSRQESQDFTSGEEGHDGCLKDQAALP